MTIELADDVATLLTERAAALGVTPEAVAARYIQERLTGRPSMAELQRRVPPLTQAEWEDYFRGFGVNCGVSLTDEQLSSEYIYE